MVADLLGGVLYAVAVYLVLALVLPRARAGRLALATLAICTAVELAQLTSVLAALVDLAPPLRFLLGTTFYAPDLVAYAAGTTAVYAADRLSTATRNSARSPKGRRSHVENAASSTSPADDASAKKPSNG